MNICSLPHLIDLAVLTLEGPYLVMRLNLKLLERLMLVDFGTEVRAFHYISGKMLNQLKHRVQCVKTTNMIIL